MESLSSYDASLHSPGTPQYKQRMRRMRTSFNHDQVRTMKSYFVITQNPDADGLEQLSYKTGLSKRVIQVCYILSLNLLMLKFIFFSSRYGLKMQEQNGVKILCVKKLIAM